MRSFQFALRDLGAVVRRRWKYPLLSTVLTTAACVLGAFLLPREYESTATILVRPDPTLASVSGYDRMVAIEEQLRNFDEIIYSRTLLLSLADSLGMISASSASDEEIEIVTKAVQRSISTNRLGSDSFRITYADSDPVLAKRGADVLANIFIRTKLAVQTRQLALTVEFYEGKLVEYQRDLESSVESLVSSMTTQVSELPVETRALYGQVEEIERNMRNTDSRIKNLQTSLSLLTTIPEQLRSNPSSFRREDGKDRLFALERSDLPYSTELRSLMGRYDELTRRYQGDFPDIVRVEDQILDLLLRMRTATEAELSRQRDDFAQLERRRGLLVGDLRRSSVIAQQSQEKSSTYDAKKKLVDDMRIKLEQARLAKEVSERGASQYIVLDPPIVPPNPTKPNRTMIILAGVIGGFLLGIISAFLAELLDTTIRVPADVQVYNKPIIAFLPDRPHRHDTGTHAHAEHR